MVGITPNRGAIKEKLAIQMADDHFHKKLNWDKEPKMGIMSRWKTLLAIVAFGTDSKTFEFNSVSVYGYYIPAKVSTRRSKFKYAPAAKYESAVATGPVHMDNLDFLFSKATTIVWFAGIFCYISSCLIAAFYIPHSAFFYGLIGWTSFMLLLIIVAMVFKTHVFLLPFRYLLAVTRFGLIFILTACFSYILFASIDINVDIIMQLQYQGRPLTELDQYKKFYTVVRMVPVFAIGYIIIGIVSKAATCVSFFFQKEWPKTAAELGI